MIAIAVVNLKGGTGKSTIAVNLACELALKSTVTVVDTDPQGTATHYHKAGLLPVKVLSAPVENSKDVDAWARRVVAITSDFVVFDAPPALGSATQAVIGVSDVVLVPCTPSQADLAATDQAVQLVKQARSKRKRGTLPCLLVPSRVDSRTSVGREIGEALKRFQEPIGPTIHQRTAFVDAFTAGQWIGDFWLNSPAHSEIKELAKVVRRICK